MHEEVNFFYIIKVIFRTEINNWNELRLHKLSLRLLIIFKILYKIKLFRVTHFWTDHPVMQTDNSSFQIYRHLIFFFNLALGVLEGTTEKIVQRLDYSRSLLGKHKRKSTFVEVSGQNIKWIFIINTTTFLFQCITKTRITTCTLQLSVHRNDNYCL